jgi:C4-dicarboxylate-binding protein DctP
MIEGLQLGHLEAMISPPGFLAGIDPNFRVPDAPGLFDDARHAHRALNDPAFFARYARLGARRGIEVAALFVYGPTSFAGIRPMRTLDDFRRRRIRVPPSRMETELMEKVGAVGVPMRYTDILEALQRRTVDAVRSSLVVMYGSHFYRFAKFVTVVESGMIPSAVMLSETWLRKITPQQRAFIENTLRGASAWGTETGEDFARRAVQLWKAKGAEVTRLPPSEREAFMELARPLGDRYLGGDPKTSELYALLKAAAARTRAN